MRLALCILIWAFDLAGQIITDQIINDLIIHSTSAFNHYQSHGNEAVTYTHQTPRIVPLPKNILFLCPQFGA
jgi:hypothetical protein